MKRSFYVAVMVLFLFALMGSGSARATSVKVVLGGDYWMDRGGVFELMLRAEGNVSRRVALAGRVGGMLATSPSTLGIPADLVIKARLSKAYIEGMAGPWILFEDEPIRAHVALGAGIRGGSLTLGMEIGWLDPHAIVGMRVGFDI